MKKYILFMPMFLSVFILSFIFIGSNANSLSAQTTTTVVSGCMAGDMFDRTTGQPCTAATPECSVDDLFSSVTGKPCVKENPNTFCYTFNRNLGIGSSDADISPLMVALEAEGFNPNIMSTISFDKNLAAIVFAFQEKYKSEILTPIGLSAGTGYVGVRTRAKLNLLSRCPVLPEFPVNISGVSGSQTLDINQTGTWTVTASSTTGGNLSYSVIWGDEVYAVPAMSDEKSAVGQQSATFTHSYAKAGTYWPKFTVASSNTINCITTPCPTNAGSAQTMLSVTVGGTADYSSIYVLSPNGGEEWYKTTQHTIRWTASSSLKNVTISFDKIYECNPLPGTACIALYSTEILKIDNVPNSGFYEWYIPNTFTSGKYTVRIYDSTNKITGDESNKPFTII